MPERSLEYVPLADLKPNERNVKQHALEDLDKSFARFGYLDPVLVDERSGLLVAGHGRVEGLRERQARGEAAPDGVQVAADGTWLVPVVRGWASADDAELQAATIASNRLVEKGGYDDSGLAALLEELTASAHGLDGLGYSSEEFDEMVASLSTASGGPAVSHEERPTLADRFLIPPFSVFDARQGYWQDRKRHWLSLGIRSEAGRAPNLLAGPECAYGAQASVGSDGDLVYEASDGLSSIFDPVLCEIVYRWWCPAGGRVLDPFAGGSVRGVVAALLDRPYTGIDLSAEQVVSNEQQANEILRSSGRRELVSWQVGSSAEVLPAMEAEPFDLAFSCPPYFDLERYSDDPADLSNADDYGAFLAGYREIIAQTVARLAPNRFACFVVGDIRDPAGIYRGFVPDTIAAFEDAGAAFYNDIVLVTAVGSLALRAARIFGGARKVAKAHQNVLVFVKGDPKEAAAVCAPIDPADLAAFTTVEPPPADPNCPDVL